MPQLEVEEEEFVGLDEPMGFVDLIIHVLVRAFCADGFKKLFSRHYFEKNAKDKPN